MNNKKFVIVAAIAVIIGLAGGSFFGYTQGQKAGYEKAVADTKAVQEEVAKKAGEEAVKAANPFQATNPLEGITANPFQDAAKKLNPFAE